MKIACIDIETAPVKGQPSEYALQPWRYSQGKAKISLMATGINGKSVTTSHPFNMFKTLEALEGQYVTTWNGLFDVAWFVAYGFYDQVSKIKWLDGMLLWKWLENSQDKRYSPKWSLLDGATRFCKDEPWFKEFQKLKMSEVEAGEQDEYWQRRAEMDVMVTETITHKILDLLDEKRKRNAIVECACIPQVARSWVIGIPYDFSLADQAVPVIEKEMLDIETRLGVVSYADKWKPSAILRSNRQLANVMYGTWGMEPKFFSDKTGQPSCDKATLTYLADEDDRCLEILRWRELNTQLTKFIGTPKNARDYLGSDIMHPTPHLFSTYTGRMTYSSKTKRRYATGIALHQWSRNKAIRALIKPLEGYKHAEFDASGQESRLMAEFSGDAKMTEVFQKNMKFHANTAANLAGMDYDVFMAGYNSGNERICGDNGLYKQGKFAGLSCNYRIGVSKLRIQARVQYGMDVEYMTAKKWQDSYLATYPAIKHFWKSAILKAKHLKYAETLGGRRMILDRWYCKDQLWGTESTAINFPIQGTGADMKEIALVEMAKHYPHFIFWFDLHDGLHYLVPEKTKNKELLAARQMLDNIDYEHYWGESPNVPLKWDVSVGDNWSTLKEL